MYTLQLTKNQIKELENALSHSISASYVIISHPMGPTGDPNHSPVVQKRKKLLKTLMRARGVKDDEIKKYIKELSVEHY